MSPTDSPSTPDPDDDGLDVPTSPLPAVAGERCPLCAETWPCPKHHDEWGKADEFGHVRGQVLHKGCEWAAVLLRSGGWFCAGCGRLQRDFEIRAVAPDPGDVLDCSACGHRHQGSHVGGICIGCPCPAPGGSK